MQIDPKQQELLRMLPGVDRIMEHCRRENAIKDTPKSVLLAAARAVITDMRKDILDRNKPVTEDGLFDPYILQRVKAHVKKSMTFNLKRVINATGVVVHTNLGRSILAPDAIENIITVSGCYSNLEFDLSKGERGSRYSAVEDILCEISGAEAAMVVNNNAGAVLLCLETIVQANPARKEVLISRGELVEIGGAFRIPDVMAKSGGILKEVGATNRTHLKDYRDAICDKTALLLKVHTSNYRIVGFTSAVALPEMVALSREFDLLTMEDLGSGSFIDFSQYGMRKEPTVQETVATGVDVVTFSGDKLLGGPQAGIILGKKALLDKIKKNPLTRALRIDKLTLAALETTLRYYRDPARACEQLPTLNMLTIPYQAIAAKAQQLADLLETINDQRLEIQLLDRSSRAGGGAMPLQDIPSRCLGLLIKGLSANYIENYLRKYAPPIIGRIESDIFMLDLRTVQQDELNIIKIAFTNMLKEAGNEPE
ncbi:L-seryl-tRNA(Sec) selenium transferase [Desulfococcaceae bacterium HSG9]|nr:L-seryl-tRNA(Sec) selenium transferase [Desulfococcaceae bacterium HSG9]